MVIRVRIYFKGIWDFKRVWLLGGCCLSSDRRMMRRVVPLSCLDFEKFLLSFLIFFIEIGAMFEKLSRPIKRGCSPANKFWT